MQLPAFTEFIRSLSKGDMDFINGLDEESSSFSGNLATADDLTRLISFTAGKSFGISLRLLQCYHEWLEKQLLNQ